MKLSQIFFFLVLPVNVYAWQPCMPFCDSGCGGAAIQTMGSSIVSAMQSQSNANQQLLQEINNTAQSTVNLGTDLADRWTSSTIDLLSAIDARTSKLELAETTQIKQREFSTDTLVSVFNQAIRENFIANNVSDNIRTFSSVSMPETGEILANSASQIKEAYLKSNELAENITSNQAIFSEELTPGDSSFSFNSKLTSSEDIYKGHLFTCEKTLSDVELNQMQLLITYITNSKPLLVLENSQLSTPKGQEYELKRKLFNAKQQMISTIINEILSHRAQYVSHDIVRSYVSRSSTETDLSFNETLESIINGRVSSDGWFLNTKLLNESGLQREMTYLKAEENTLLFLLSQRNEWRNQLLASIVIEDLGQQLNKLNK